MLLEALRGMHGWLEKTLTLPCQKNMYLGGKIWVSPVRVRSAARL